MLVTFKRMKYFLLSTVKSLYDTYFSQYCVRRKYISGSEDPFLAFLDLIKSVYNPQKQKEEFVSREPLPSAPAPIKKTRTTLIDITNTLNNSLDDFM